MAKAPTDIRSLARTHSTLAINTLAGICRTSESDTARAMAATALLDRGWGKPAQAHTGENGEGAIQFTIRHILEARPGRELEPAPVTIDHQEPGEKK